MKRQREFLVEARFNLGVVSNGCGKEGGGGREEEKKRRRDRTGRRTRVMDGSGGKSSQLL